MNVKNLKQSSYIAFSISLKYGICDTQFILLIIKHTTCLCTPAFSFNVVTMSHMK